MPSLLVPHHGVEDGEQLAHGDHQSHFLQFALVAEMLVESADGGMMAGGGQGSYIVYFAHIGAATPDAPPTPLLASVLVQGCDTDQSGHLAAVALSQFWQVGDQDGSRGQRDSRHAVQQFNLVPPGLDGST